MQTKRASDVAIKANYANPHIAGIPEFNKNGRDYAYDSAGDNRSPAGSEETSNRRHC
jgi:hypothetical protein